MEDGVIPYCGRTECLTILKREAVAKPPIVRETFNRREWTADSMDSEGQDFDDWDMGFPPMSRIRAGTGTTFGGGPRRMMN